MDHEEVALISMPFGGIRMPSLALSLLSAELQRIEIPTAVHYFNIPFAERIGIARYDRYAENLDFRFLGEWIFSDCVFPRPAEAGERFVEEMLIPLGKFSLEDIEKFEEDRALTQAFLDECLLGTDWTQYRIIGFTSTFEQNTASLAFARMVKAVAPDSTIVFGGANCEGVMGAQLQQSFPWIDYVCTGDGDEVFPTLVQQLLGRAPRSPLPGIVGAGNDPPQPARMVTNLDQLPVPDFTAYFDRVERSPLHGDLSCRLLMETSRGCWWGEKHHCTFCGLNGMGMRFRSKSSARALDEITALTEKYGHRVDPALAMFLTDNILDLHYLTTLLPALRDTGLGVSLFYETKANLTRDQVRLLAECGVRVIQPGIESLHTGLLRLMRKGCTASQNIQLLKWCREFRVRPLWNMLFGFPGEDPAWFEEQVGTIGKLGHLSPPSGISAVRLDRFSPYFMEPEAHGISRIRPARSLSHIYPLPEAELARIAYHFDFDFDDGRDPTQYIGPLATAVGEWQAHEDERFFCAIPWRDQLILWDGRRGEPDVVHVLPNDRRQIYEQCDRVRGRVEITSYAQREAGLTEGAAAQLLDEWLEAGLLFGEQETLLGLAVTVAGAVESRTDLRGAIAGQGDPVRDRNVIGGRSSQRPLRDRRSRWNRITEDEVIVLDGKRERLQLLEGLASRVWNRCDGVRTVAAIAQEFAAAGAGSAESVQRDTVRVIDYLEEQGLLDRTAAHAE